MYCDIDSNSLEYNNRNKWAFSTARYIVCILTVLGIKTACIILYDVARGYRELDVRLLRKIDRHKVLIYAILLAILYHTGEKFYADEFHLVLAAFLIIKYLDMSETSEKYSIERLLDNKISANEIKYNRTSEMLKSTMKVLKTALNIIQVNVKGKVTGDSSDDCGQYAIGLAKKLRAFSEEDREEIIYSIDGIIINSRRAKEQNSTKCNAFDQHSFPIPSNSGSQIYMTESRPEHNMYLQSSAHSGTKTNGLNLSYGVGMACGYVQGYLDIVIPSDGMDYKGFMGNLESFQSIQGVIFPVKKLFIIMTKSMYSPPDLKDFNLDTDRNDVAWLEACSSIGQVVKDVAGVKNRLYSTSAYKINRPGKRPVYICAECVGSFYTFYKIMKNTMLFEELANVCVEDIVSDFITMLRKVLPKSFELKDKIELIYFDDSKGLNLADVLLNRVKELVPDFEKLIGQRY